MKLTFIVCISLISSNVVFSQTENDPEHIIRRIIESGNFAGHDQKVIGPLGDAAAVVLTKVFAGRDLTSNNIDDALVIIDASFADPTFVIAVADRQPKTALLLLRYFDVSKTDPALKKRIAETRKYVQDHYAASLKAPKQ